MAPRDWSGLSLVVGVAIAEALHPDLGLKWPNDLWWQDRKVGGILVETAGSGDASAERSVVVGVGLNIVTPAVTDGLRTPPAGLRELMPGITATAALGAIVAPLRGPCSISPSTVLLPGSLALRHAMCCGAVP